MALEAVWKEVFYGVTSGGVLGDCFDNYQEAVDHMKKRSERDHFEEFNIEKRFIKDYRNVEPEPEVDPTISSTIEDLMNLVRRELFALYETKVQK